MTYALLNLAVLSGVATLSALIRWRTPRPFRVSWREGVVTLGALLVLTAIFDNVMIAVGLVGYDPHHISGVFIGVAPIEDFAYSIAAALLLPALWQKLAARKGPA